MKSALPVLAVGLCAVLPLGVAAGAQSPRSPVPASTTAIPQCRIRGRVTTGNIPLPGVSLVVPLGAAHQAVTSTDTDGSYSLALAPDATYRLSADFVGFVGTRRDLPLGAPPCDQTIDLELALQPRDLAPPSGDKSAAAGATVLTERAAAGETPNLIAPESDRSASTPTERRSGGRRDAASSGQGDAAGDRRFQTLSVRPNAGGEAALDTMPAPESEDVSTLLPPGFSLQSAQADAVAITGSNDATNLNRRLMNARAQMINLGQLDPTTGQFAQGFGPPNGGPPPGAGGFGQGPSDFGNSVGRGGGPGGRGGFLLGGRSARGQNPYQGSATYTFGGSVLDAPPYQLRQDVPVTQPAFTRNAFGATFGGPFKIPGLYANEHRRTNFQINYTGSRSNSVFDQYATVPTDAERNGDFSGLPIQPIDPTTGQPFRGNQIPQSSINSSAASLMPFIPAPNLLGTTQNYHVSTIAPTSSEAISFRMTQNLSPNVPQGPNGPAGPGGFGEGFGGGFGGGRRGGGFGGPIGATGTNILLSAQLQYRRNETQALNVFPNLGSDTTNTSLTLPVSLNVRRGRSIQNVTFNLTHATTGTTNAFANTDNVATLAGIQYPSAASTDPLNWGVPNLSFTGLTGVQSPAASQRTNDRVTIGYAWIHPSGAHRLRMGGDYRLDRSDAEINGNARGTFLFTGFYTSGGASVLGPTAADYSFADFLLGLPQQASVQVGGTSHLRQHAFDGYFEDNWQKSPKLTVNLGLRYELALPYTEASGRMANLDVAPNFFAAAPVQPGGVGPYTGAFPAGLLNADTNNLGPRLGFAYRLRPSTILRGGYSITYNSGSYASIARELVGQPPFAEVETIANADPQAPLTLAQALLSTPSSTTTNNWGIDKDYALGMIQTWNTTVTRNLSQNWLVQAGYTGVKGSDLDILRAPALGLGGSFIAGTQPFIWESSGGRSIMNGGTFQLQRRLANGYSGGVSYTLAKAMDNTASLGAGSPVVAQNDNNLTAEWASSNFDRRQQLSGNLYVELPWGANRRWLNGGGTLAAILGEWSAQFTLTLQSGTPVTARVLGVANDLLRGVNGSIRADYNGAPIQLSDPTVDEFFNVTAFSVPAPGTFGDSSRNMIVGPGARQLNALFQRDLRLGGTRSLTLQINANNLLNTVQWAAVDTNVNSPTFGEALSAKPMRTVTVTARLRF